MDAERERKRERAWGIWKASIRSFAQRWVFIWKIEIIFTSSSALYQTVIEFYSEITVFLLFAEIRSSNCISTRLDSRSVFLSVSALVFLSLPMRRPNVVPSTVYASHLPFSTNHHPRDSPIIEKLFLIRTFAFRYPRSVRRKFVNPPEAGTPRDPVPGFYRFLRAECDPKQFPPFTIFRAADLKRACGTKSNR